MLKNVANILNFTYTIENPPDGKWGHIGKFLDYFKILHKRASGPIDDPLKGIFDRLIKLKKYSLISN